MPELFLTVIGKMRGGARLPWFYLSQTGSFKTGLHNRQVFAATITSTFCFTRLVTLGRTVIFRLC